MVALYVSSWAGTQHSHYGCSQGKEGMRVEHSVWPRARMECKWGNRKSTVRGNWGAQAPAQMWDHRIVLPSLVILKEIIHNYEFLKWTLPIFKQWQSTLNIKVLHRPNKTHPWATLQKFCALALSSLSNNKGKVL